MTSKSKKYNNTKLTLGIIRTILSLLTLIVFVSTGLSEWTYNIIAQYGYNDYINLILFTLLTGIASGILFFPLGFYSGYTLEHKYNLSNQTIGKYFKEELKGTLVGGIVGFPILLVFFWVLNYFGEIWWLPFAIFMFVFSVLLAQIAPVVILPLFYKITPIENDSLKDKIVKLGNNAGMNVENIYKFDMSKNTKKANAAFTGFGKTKRIILGDTLLENFTEDEIETVLAHELGHFKRKHIIKNIFIGTASSFLTLYLIALLYSNSVEYFGFSSILEVAALPLLALWGMLIGFIQTPISNIISRKFEYEADEYAIRETGKREEFIATLDKLTEQNLGDREPHPLVEWYSYSHPSIKKRVEHINSIQLD